MEQFWQIVAAAISVPLTQAIAISTWRHCKSAHRSLRYARPLFAACIAETNELRSLIFGDTLLDELVIGRRHYIGVLCRRLLTLLCRASLRDHVRTWNS
jgi:hypothetical protein